GLLFSKGTLYKQAHATNQAQSLSAVPLLIALDGEWGLGMRLTDAPRYPRNQVIGAIRDEETVQLYGRETARQCREMGIQVNFAPSVDVHTNRDNPVIGNRSYGENPQRVARLGIAYAKGLEENGVMAVAKHFPGHGDTSEDSHHTLPVIAHDQQRLDTVELLPFREYIRAGLSGMMLGHLDVPTWETQGIPASLSPEIGIRLLKEELGFTGLTFTDAMAMKGVSDQPEACVKALLAGNDILLGAGNLKKAFTSVKTAAENGTLPASLLEEKVRKILAYKYILGLHTVTPVPLSTVHSRVNSPSATWVQRKIYDKAITLLKNDSDRLPLKALDRLQIASVAIGAREENPFQRYLRKYGNVTPFTVASAEDAASIEELKAYDLVILSVHSDKIRDTQALQQLTKEKNTVLVLFTSPARLESFPATATNATALIMAYDASEAAQISAAQALFGGIALSGRLPVTAGNYPEGTGLETEKVRLGYSLPEEAGIPSERLDRIEQIAQEGIRQRAYPGCQVVVAKDGVVIYERAFGRYDYEEDEEVTDETVYDLASVTKAAATLPAVMKLYDEGKMRLQDPVSKFVAETRGSDKADITLRSLLFHESGITPFIPYYTSAIDPESYSGSLFGRRSPVYHVRYAGAWARTDYTFLPELISRRRSEQFHLPVAKGLYASDKMHEILLRDVIRSPLRTRGRYLYSCLNFMLLKEAVEAATQTDLDSYVKATFYRKLGAVTTTFRPLELLPLERIAPTEEDPFFRRQHLRGYVHDEGAALFGGISGNAGLFSNGNDLAKLCQMWLNGGEYGGERLLRKETVRLFTTMKSTVSRRGLGFDKPDPVNSKASPASPGTPIEVYGHTGFTGTSFWVDPVHNLIYIFLANRVNPSRSPNRFSTLSIRERIQEELYKAIRPDLPIANQN
ncbi:MAG: glycoside hydrolase family 3 N-terminal domain-containing protein, partial [Proteiniphilum sp.]|nr:glycoside hydrolase family 3 N-terminal domain-containing protein [Proteiniphilum sp.]